MTLWLRNWQLMQRQERLGPQVRRDAIARAPGTQSVAHRPLADPQELLQGVRARRDARVVEAVEEVVLVSGRGFAPFFLKVPKRRAGLDQLAQHLPPILQGLWWQVSAGIPSTQGRQGAKTQRGIRAPDPLCASAPLVRQAKPG
jgi:hypothetical protein